MPVHTIVNKAAIDGRTFTRVPTTVTSDRPSIKCLAVSWCSGSLGGGSGATGANLLRMMNPQKLMKKGGAVKSASARADGIAVRGKTRA